MTDERGQTDGSSTAQASAETFKYKYKYAAEREPPASDEPPKKEVHKSRCSSDEKCYLWKAITAGLLIVAVLPSAILATTLLIGLLLAPFLMLFCLYERLRCASLNHASSGLFRCIVTGTLLAGLVLGLIVYSTTFTERAEPFRDVPRWVDRTYLTLVTWIDRTRGHAEDARPCPACPRCSACEAPEKNSRANPTPRPPPAAKPASISKACLEGSPRCPIPQIVTSRLYPPPSIDQPIEQLLRQAPDHSGVLFPCTTSTQTGCIPQ